MAQTNQSSHRLPFGPLREAIQREMGRRALGLESLTLQLAGGDATAADTLKRGYQRSNNMGTVDPKVADRWLELLGRHGEVVFGADEWLTALGLLPRHGTVERYWNTKFPCRLDCCRVARNAYQRTQKRKQAARLRKLPAHPGSRTCYAGGCRRPACIAENKAYLKVYRSQPLFRLQQNRRRQQLRARRRQEQSLAS